MIEASQLAERVVGHPLPGKLKSGGNLVTYRARAASTLTMRPAATVSPGS